MTLPAPSPTMLDCLAVMHAHGVLIRFSGGYWAPTTAKRDTDGVPHPHWGTSTIEACVRRGAARYTKHREGRKGAFPIRVAPVEGKS